MLGVFDLLSKSWEVYKDRFGTLIGIAAVPIVGSLIAVIASTAGAFLTRSFWKSFSLVSPLHLFISGLILLLAAAWILFVFIWPGVALIYAVKERKREIGFRQSFGKAWPKLLSYLWVSFLSGLAVFAGLILLIIPGIIFMVWFSFSVYVLIAEDRKGTQALSRSKQLVKGRWWKVFGRLVMLWLLGLIVVGVLNSVPLVGTLIANLLISSFSVVYLYLLYEDLKEQKERIQISQEK